MFYGSSSNKKIIFIILIFFITIRFDFCFKTAFAEAIDSELENSLSNNVDDILNEINFDELDNYLDESIFEISSNNSFKDIVVSILNGNYFDEYNSIFDLIKSLFFNDFNEYLRFFALILAIAILYEIFKNFCFDKYADFKASIKMIFSFILASLLLVLFKSFADETTNIVNSIFSFCNILFPILLSLITLAGATGTLSVTSSLSVFILETGAYLIKFLILPISISLLILSCFGSIFNSYKFDKLADILKSLYKVIIAIFFGAFGLFSVASITTASVSDGINIKLTKFAIKNYVPILGGYISDGFDFVRACSVLIKNAVGISSIIILLFMILKPILSYIAYILLFKVLSLLLSLLSNDGFGNSLLSISNSISYFITVLVGTFLIMFVYIYILILSVGVV